MLVQRPRMPRRGFEGAYINAPRRRRHEKLDADVRFVGRSEPAIPPPGKQFGIELLSRNDAACDDPA